MFSVNINNVGSNFDKMFVWFSSNATGTTNRAETICHLVPEFIPFFSSS
jgi:hypothetical protein